MRTINLRHEINCDVETFWKVFFARDFNMALFLEELRFPSYEILELDESDTKIVRRIKGRPKMDAPKAVMKIIGDSFGYEEEGTFERSTGVFTWKMFPNALQGKLNTSGTVRCEPVGDDKCRRLADIDLEAKVFGLGKIIENTSEKQFRDGWDKSAGFMNRWLADHPPA